MSPTRPSEISQDAFSAWYENEFNPNPTGSPRTGTDYRECLFMAFEAGRKSAGRICLEVGRKPAGKAEKALRMVKALLPAIRSLESTARATCRGVDDLRGGEGRISGKNGLSEAIRLIDETRNSLVLISRKFSITEQRGTL
jgi:hypothetical protein